MPFTLRKRIDLLKLGRWVRFSLNLSKTGVSRTVKVGPVTRTKRRGRTPRTSVDLPGPVSYVRGGKAKRKPPPKKRQGGVPPLGSPPPPVEYKTARPESGRFDPYS